jgi:DNA-binding GntR family transcriptional regulator
VNPSRRADTPGAKPSPKQSESNDTIVDQLANELRQKILTRSLAPGSSLKQTDIARQYRISPIPVREALRRLESEGYVVFEPFKGAKVATVSMNELLEQVEIGIALHTHAMRLGYPYLTPIRLAEARALAEDLPSLCDTPTIWRRARDIHAIVCSAERWPILWNMVSTQFVVLVRFGNMYGRARTTINDPGSFLKRLLDTLEAGQLDDAVDVVVQRYRDYVREVQELSAEAP